MSSQFTSSVRQSACSTSKHLLSLHPFFQAVRSQHIKACPVSSPVLSGSPLPAHQSTSCQFTRSVRQSAPSTSKHVLAVNPFRQAVRLQHIKARPISSPVPSGPRPPY
ncbi:hypothetical protein ElyMa_003839500 [Elysia marginata]|uniref:Uncharacterized protein n=1 Tax=Elysia marginata TaxID=1093978 RepID=A0AAV4FGF9_9GAST|nr:hypothetical protein ElyMa_003839500 [Elysia marginata]